MFTLGDVDRFIRYLRYLENPAVSFGEKVRRICVYRGIKTAEEVVRELEGLFALDEIVRRSLIRWILREVMGLSPEQVNARMVRVRSAGDAMARAVQYLNREFNS